MAWLKHIPASGIESGSLRCDASILNAWFDGRSTRFRLFRIHYSFYNLTKLLLGNAKLSCMFLLIYIKERLIWERGSLALSSVWLHYRCTFDYLELFDGNDTMTSPSLGKFCGYKFTPISSTQRFLTLQFVTDYSIQLSGFKLYYNFTNEVVRECWLY